MLMSDEARQCPVTPQELRDYAEWFPRHTTSENYYDARVKCGWLRALADWLEKPAPAAVRTLVPEDQSVERIQTTPFPPMAGEPTRCPQCDHAVHAGKCLQVLRVGKPGEDKFCLCEPTRAAEGQECTCGVVIQEGPFVYAPEVPDGAVLKIEYCELHQPAPPAQARPTREQVLAAFTRATYTRGKGLAHDVTDEIMKLLEGQ